MYSVSDLQKLVQMLNYLGFSPNIAPAHYVVIGGGSVAPGASGTLFASNGPSADPSFQTLATLGIQPALGYVPARSGANSDITSLASPALGSATATTQARGTNNTTVATTAFVTRQAPFLNILDFGGDNTGVSSNNTAFTNAVAAAPAGAVSIYFPAGTYLFSSSAVYNFSTTNPASISIKGDGPDLTTLKFTAAGSPGLSIGFDGPYSSAHIRDLTIAAGGAPSSNTGIFFNQLQTTVANPANSALSDVSNVTFRGSDGYVLTNGWSVGMEVSSVSNINFTNCTWVGPTAGTTGVLLTARSTALGVVYQFQGCTFNYIGTGIEYAQWIQGVTVAQCNLTGGTNGIFTPGSQPGLDELLVYGNQFNCSGNGVLLQTGIESTQIFGNMFLVPANANGAQLSYAGNNTITGNTFSTAVGGATGNNGLVISGTINNWPVIVTGNSFNQMAGDGIQLGSGSRNVNVQSNVYFGNGTNVLNAGTGNTIGGGSP
jgi:hypothetical protein